MLLIKQHPKGPALTLEAKGKRFSTTEEMTTWAKEHLPPGSYWSWNRRGFRPARRHGSPTQPKRPDHEHRFVPYYTTARKDLRPFMPNIPVMISAASCVRRYKDGAVVLLPPRLPAHLTELAADCGGYSVATRWNGVYPFTLRQYIAWLDHWPLLPRWAAIPDLPCVAAGKGRKYPGREVVLARQRFTTEMIREVWATAAACPWQWGPCVQGFFPWEYAEHALELRDLLGEMAMLDRDTASYEEDDAPQAFRVGIGSLCGATPRQVYEIVRQVQTVLGYAFPLHLFAFKLKGVQAGLSMPGVISGDTGAFNDRFNPEARQRQRDSGKPQSQFLWEEAQPGYAARLDLAQHRPRQTSLFPLEPASYALPFSIAHDNV